MRNGGSILDARAKRKTMRRLVHRSGGRGIPHQEVVSMDSNAVKRLHYAYTPRRNATLRDYLTIARLDHSSKHVFIVPGLVFAYLLRGAEAKPLMLDVMLGFLATICIASTNYVIN